MSQAQQKSHKRLLLILVGIVIAMLGFVVLLVPLYDAICRVTGLQGKISESIGPVDGAVDTTRLITTQFISNVYANTHNDFEFGPCSTEEALITMHPGEIVRVDFCVKNNKPEPVILQAIPSAAPNQAAFYLKKTECFCFSQQEVGAGEAQVWPVLFHIDRDLPKEYGEIALSYTLYDTSNISQQLPRGAHLGHIH